MPDACCMCGMLTGIHVSSQSCPTQQLELLATVYMRTANVLVSCCRTNVKTGLYGSLLPKLFGCFLTAASAAQELAWQAGRQSVHS